MSIRQFIAITIPQHFDTCPSSRFHRTDGTAWPDLPRYNWRTIRSAYDAAYAIVARARELDRVYPSLEALYEVTRERYRAGDLDAPGDWMICKCGWQGISTKLKKRRGKDRCPACNGIASIDPTYHERCIALDMKLQNARHELGRHAGLDDISPDPAPKSRGRHGMTGGPPLERWEPPPGFIGANSIVGNEHYAKSGKLVTRPTLQGWEKRIPCKARTRAPDNGEIYYPPKWVQRAWQTWRPRVA